VKFATKCENKSTRKSPSGERRSSSGD
jgi:hypothetical protein